MCNKKIIFSFFIFFIYLFCPVKVSAQVVINEFSSNSNPEWVEIYNAGGDQLDLTGWMLADGNSIDSDDITLDGCISPHGFRLFNHSDGWLNNSGSDSLVLKNQYLEVQDLLLYGSGGVIGIPGNTKSAGRSPDGADTWVIFDSPTPENSYCQLPPTPTPTNTPAIVPSNTLTPSSTPTTIPKATYKINEAKNASGVVLNSVKIYLDGDYICHYPPEDLIFCNGCQHECDEIMIDYGFGEHEIRLEKTGYDDWSETKSFVAGSYYEVNPVMNLVGPTNTPTPTSTPVPTSTKIPSSSPKLTPTLSQTPTPTPTEEEISLSTLSGEILGEEVTATPSAGQNKNPGKLLSFIAIISGLGFIGTSGYFFLKSPALKK